MAKREDEAREGRVEAPSFHVLRPDRLSRPLYPEIGGDGAGGLERLSKAEDLDGRSRQGVRVGRIPHPFNVRAVLAFKDANEHHSTCVETKRAAISGLGFTSQRVADRLDELCEVSWQDVLDDAVEDRVQTGSGYVEVVRKEASTTSPITGLHHVPVADVHVHVESKDFDKHFEVQSPEGGPTLRMARFGDVDDFYRRNKSLVRKQDKVSEIIELRRSNSKSRHYGYPDWLSCVASVETVQMLTQHAFDFFLNRGVPEFLLLFTGKKIASKDWEKIEEKFKANIGSGNSHKSMLLNIAEEIDVVLHKLALESKADGVFSEHNDTLAMRIVSAHRVPPLLAGILIPGKLGATNELPNALMAFQSLVVGQEQHSIETTLARTLGAPRLNGRLGLPAKLFELRTILEEIDLGVMDTTSRMRQTVPEARAEGRDLGAGVKKSGRALAAL